MSTVHNGSSRKESSSKGKPEKKVFSSLVLNAKGFLVEINFHPGKSDANDGMFFARMNLLMGKTGDNFDYQPISVLVGGKAKPPSVRIVVVSNFQLILGGRSGMSNETIPRRTQAGGA
jgi:hypothetical protein